MSIPFTQFKRPSGREVPVTIERPKHIEAMARSVADAGGRFTCEVLVTGEAHLCCEFNDADLATEVCDNSPGSGIPEAVDRLICDAFEAITGLAANREGVD